MIFIPEAKSMASAVSPGPTVNCSHHAADGGAVDVAFTAGVITVAVAFCVISVVSLCHCVRHVLAGGAQKADPRDMLFCTEDEVEMAELRHFPLPHTGQVPRVRTPPSPSPSPMKFLLSPPEARLSQTRLMSSRALAAEQSAREREPARLTRSLPSLHTLSGSRAAHGTVEHYVEMALVSAMTASSNHELETLAPEPGPGEPLLPHPSPPPPPPPPPISLRDSSSRGRRRMQRKRYPRTPLPRGALVAVTSAPPVPSHGTVDTDYRSAYAPSQVTDSDDPTTATREAATTAETAATAATVGAKAPKSAGSRCSTSGKASKTAVRETGRALAGRLEPRREGSELILVSRRALERLLRRPLTAAELHTGGSDQNRDRDRDKYSNGDRDRDWDLNRNRKQNRNRDREQDDTMHISGLQPLEDTAMAHEDSIPVRSETAGVLADTEDNLGDTVGTLGETGPLEDAAGNLRVARTLTDTAETLENTIGTLGDTVETLENTTVTLGDTSGTAEEQRRGWIPEPPSPEWDPSAEPRFRRQSAPVLAVSPRSHSIV